MEKIPSINIESPNTKSPDSIRKNSSINTHPDQKPIEPIFNFSMQEISEDQEIYYSPADDKPILYLD